MGYDFWDLSYCCLVPKSCLTLQPHGLQPTRLLCPSLSPRVCSNSCPLSRWGHPTISRSAAPFSFCLQSFPASGSFPVSRLFISGGQSIRASPQYFQWISGLTSFRIDWFDLSAVSGTLKSLLQHNLKASILQHLAFFMTQFSHPCMTTGKSIALTIWTFVGKMMSPLFNILSRFVIAFLPRSKRKSFNFTAAVTFGVHSDFGAWENKICHCFHFFSFYLPWSDRTGCVIIHIAVQFIKCTMFMIISLQW